MKNTPSMQGRAYSRRDFLKLSGLTALSIGGMTVLTACGPSTETKDSGATDAKSDAASSFGEGGKLRVGMEVAYPPYNWQTSEATDDTIPVEGLDGAYADGIDIFVAKKVAAAFGLEAVAVKLAWSGLIEALNAGQIDCIIAGMTPTDERKQSIDFSDPYFIGHYGLLVKKDSPYASATSFADFAGASVLGQKDTLLDTVIDEIEGVNHMTPVDSVPAQLSTSAAPGGRHHLQRREPRWPACRQPRPGGRPVRRLLPALPGRGLLQRGPQEGPGRRPEEDQRRHCRHGRGRLHLGDHHRPSAGIARATRLTWASAALGCADALAVFHLGGNPT